jgi:hypothetical protein
MADYLLKMIIWWLMREKKGVTAALDTFVLEDITFQILPDGEKPEEQPKNMDLSNLINIAAIEWGESLVDMMATCASAMEGRDLMMPTCISAME